MSFKLFIYYCAACGGWAALIAWLVAYSSGIVTLADAGHTPDEVKRLVISSSRQTGAILGLLLGCILGTLDACFNDRGARRIARVFICLAVGWLGGFCFA